MFAAGVTPEVNLRNPLQACDKELGFETQGRRHRKFKTGVSVAPEKLLMFSKNEKKTSASVIVPFCQFKRVYTGLDVH